MNYKYYLIKPEVAGQLGDNSVLDYSTKPPTVVKLHYLFDGWLGDDILAGFQCFICSEFLTKYLKQQKLTGFRFEECEISKSDLYMDIHSELELPQFYWFKVYGKYGDDFFLTPKNSLIVSDRALNILKQFSINYCDVEEYGSAT